MGVLTVLIVVGVSGVTGVIGVGGEDIEGVDGVIFPKVLLLFIVGVITALCDGTSV